MAGQEHLQNCDSTLLNGVAHQLAHEGDDQQNNDQQVLARQSSTTNNSHRLSRKLSRRTSGLEQDFGLCQKELIDCQRKLLDCQKENTKLQEELSEVNIYKSKLAELLRRENEERAKLEKQQSLFQSQAFTATFEKDRLTSEIEKLERKEDQMTEKLTDLQDRLDQIDTKYTEEKSLCANLQQNLKISNQEVVLYREVINKLWRLRAQACRGCESESTEERAAILLQDGEGYWSYGELNKSYHDEAAQARESLAILQQELDVCRNSLVNCQAQNVEETKALKHSEGALINCRQQLLTLAKQVECELQQLSSLKAGLKEDVSVFFHEETDWMLSLQEALQHVFQEQKVAGTGDEPVSDMSEQCSKVLSDNAMKVCCSKENLMVDSWEKAGLENGDNASDQLDSSATKDPDSLVVPANGTIDKELPKAVLATHDEIIDLTIKFTNGQNDKGVTQDDDDEISSQNVAVDDCTSALVDDSKEALAQALQEKVAALLLLSQQEERHILESNTAIVLESEISSLKQQLLQVTGEKVDALMELAQAHEELRKLKETFKHDIHQSRTLSSGQLTPIEDYSTFFDSDKNLIASESARKASMQSYLKHLWLKAPELGARTKSLSHMLTLRSSKDTDGMGVARLRIENATLRESLMSIRHLCKSANRLRLTLARVAADSSAQTESSFQAAVEAVDGVISEALHLKVALHDSIPVDDLGWNSIGSPLAKASEADPDSSNYDANDDLHIVSFFGLEIIRLVLLAAQLQKRCLGQTA